MSKLFSPLKIKEVVLKNRIVVSPMCQYSAVDGFANDWHLVHYGGRAVGGAALIIQEATAVAPEGRITPSDLGLYHDDQIEKLKNITAFIHQQGAIAGIQLAHAGRKASCAIPWKGGRQIPKGEGGWETIGPSTIAFYKDDQVPLYMDIARIQKVVSDFGKATERALQAGFKVLEIHAAHGYLIHQFLSPLSNTRSDDYGGCFENRIRLLMEVVEVVKGAWPDDLPLLVRISATDWVEGGWNPDEAVRLCAILRDRGVDLIDCSTGGMVPDAKIPLGPGFQVPFAKRIRLETGMLTSSVGLITSAQQAENILADGAADLIMIGREFLREPYFPLKSAAILEDEITWPNQYIRARF